MEKTSTKNYKLKRQKNREKSIKPKPGSSKILLHLINI